MTLVGKIDLSKPFRLPQGAFFVATQGTAVADPIYTDDRAPGLIHLCVRKDAAANCAPFLDGAFGAPADISVFVGIHYLELARIVYPFGRLQLPVLQLRVATLHSGDGGQGHATMLLAYRPAERRFTLVFKRNVGGNRNEEVRYIEAGPLTGAMVSIEPTEDAPFRYWVEVSRPSSSYQYKRVLRYRGATTYGDTNDLAVIDSEMPNILRQLGLSHAGDRLPLPSSRCLRPHLVNSELWCS